MLSFSRLWGRSGPSDPEKLRRRMVEEQIRARGVDDERVLGAMREVPRHLFVPSDMADQAYADGALPIGRGQTISQPYIVAYMTALLEPEAGRKTLEVGTGSGYQAAVLAACGLDVFSIERMPELHERARESLRRAGYLDRVRLRLGDGSRGWPEEAPFDRMLVTAAAREVPSTLRDQLAAGGVLVAPVGDPWLQTITRFRKTAEGELEREPLEGARFVPLVSGSPGASGAGAQRRENDGARGEGEGPSTGKT